MSLTAGLHHAIRYALDCLHMGDVAEAEARLLPAVGFLASRERWHEHLADLREAQGLPRGPAATPPRSWHYVTERLPKSRQRVRFWRHWPANSSPALSQEGQYILTKEGHSWFGAWPTTDRAVFSPDGSVVYAWEPEPEPPPLPEVER